MSQRQYPKIHPAGSDASRPISFVTVRFSDDYLHNILRSECVHDALNELITIDNRKNLFFDNLGQAINAGLERARNELIAVVHEDVLLPTGWQQRLERSLSELEGSDPDWGLLGSVGWDARNDLIGHWSDPYVYRNTFSERDFEPVRTIDEQLMLFRRSTGLRLDEFLPSIHGIGRDLASTLGERGLRTYVINAPTIHKYANEQGMTITVREESPKIVGRELPSFAADWDCCEEYLAIKWPEWRSSDQHAPQWDHVRFSEDIRRSLEEPVILLSRGGSGSRLVSSLARDAGVFLGNEVSLSGDSSEMVRAIYMAVLNRHLHRVGWQKEGIVPRIRLAAAEMLERAPSRPLLWGFKLPESLLILPELDQAFSRARYLHLIRDPLTTCLRRTHMTARLDNTIGRLAIREAYRHSGRDLSRSLEDSPALRMAFTTLHQLKMGRKYALEHFDDRYHELRFEDLLSSPGRVLAGVGRWLGVQPTNDSIAREIDQDRAARPSAIYAPLIEERVAATLEPLRRELGYL
ncbi:MAG: sulfotransferase [Acidobacteriota bacterium]|nr:sulfotransferase [Acidobacteriota bacterium]